VDGDKAGEYLFVGQVRGPPVSFSHQCINCIVVLPDQSDEPAIVNLALIIGERTALATIGRRSIQLNY